MLNKEDMIEHELRKKLNKNYKYWLKGCKIEDIYKAVDSCNIAKFYDYDLDKSVIFFDKTWLIGTGVSPQHYFLDKLKSNHIKKNFENSPDWLIKIPENKKECKKIEFVLPLNIDSTYNLSELKNDNLINSIRDRTKTLSDKSGLEITPFGEITSIRYNYFYDKWEYTYPKKGDLSILDVIIELNYTNEDEKQNLILAHELITKNKYDIQNNR